MDIVFFPYAAAPKKTDVRLLVRSAGDPYALVEPMRKILHELDPDQALPEADTWQDSYGNFARLLRLGTHTIGAMGVLGLALALVGLYGLLVFEVNARTREIGIRMALGAAQGSVVRMVLRQGFALAVCGVGAGMVLNLGAERVLMAIFGVGAGIVSGSGNSSAAPNPTPPPNGGNVITFQVGSDTFGHYGFAALVVAVFVVTMLAAYLPARRASRVDPNVALRCE
jgi:ABC-type antimicrobial peptide transport system permease subunit